MWSIFPQASASAAKHVETKGICGPIGILELIKEHGKFSSPECIEVHCYPHILIYEYMTLVQPMESKQFLRSVKVKECAFLHSKLSYRHFYSILDSLFSLKDGREEKNPFLWGPFETFQRRVGGDYKSTSMLYNSYCIIMDIERSVKVNKQ